MNSAFRFTVLTIESVQNAVRQVVDHVHKKVLQKL